ncbi:hypothetical protein Zmor_025938 [Zophobas morio]|uniref:Uncharacterized protein n=1 Tax=Zophobas morio TaxID=2755281 RepID=A0AA38HXY1_9CUCU|nr:hypothetical protein Zmor_025938 [Zophobas morio]
MLANDLICTNCTAAITPSDAIPSATSGSRREPQFLLRRANHAENRNSTSPVTHLSPPREAADCVQNIKNAVLRIANETDVKKFCDYVIKFMEGIILDGRCDNPNILL